METIALNAMENEFDEEVFRSIPAEALYELNGGPGTDTPAEALAEDVTRMKREGLTLSDMTDYYSWSHKKWNSRAGNKINKITIHHMAGCLSKAQMDSCVYNPNRQMSCNYAICADGTIVCYVPEEYRSWCSSSWENDKNAITIEVANNALSPNWTVSDKVYKILIKLVADICKRYGITPKYTGKTSGSLTVHQMFANTACPGPYLSKLHQNGTIEKDVKEILNPAPKTKKITIYKVQCGAFKNKANAVSYQLAIKSKGFDTVLISENGYFKVQCGAFENKANAEALLAKIKAAGFGGVIVTAQKVVTV